MFSGYSKLDAVYNCIVAMEQPGFHPAGLSIVRSMLRQTSGQRENSGWKQEQKAKVWN